MIKVYIVDDEAFVTEGLRNFINASFDTMEIVGIASDGLTAFEDIKTLMPDIVITDVRMPGMSGVELSKKLRAIMPSVEILFISGYDDVDYIRNALKVEAIDYILKPVDIEELKQVLTRFEKKFNKKTTDRKRFVEMEQKLLQSMPALRQRFFYMLINRYRRGNKKAEFNREILCQRMKFLNIDFPYAGKFITVAMWIDNVEKLYSSEDYMDIELFSFAIQNVMQDIIDKYTKGYVFETEYNEFGAILYFDTDYSEALLKLADEMHKTMMSTFNLKTVLGIGDEVYKISEIGMSWEFADDSVREKKYLGMNQTIYLVPHSNVDINQDKLSNVVAKIKEIIDRRYSEKLSLSDIASEVFLTPTYICLLFKEDTGITINEYITRVRMAKARDFLQNTDMKFSDIAECIGYSDASYFSKLFKRYEGMLPSEYRNKKRKQ